jgi:hypothetical protein
MLAGCSNGGSGSSAPAASAAASVASTAEPAIAISSETEQLTCALLGKDIKIACIVIAKEEGLYADE